MTLDKVSIGYLFDTSYSKTEKANSLNFYQTVQTAEQGETQSGSKNNVNESAFQSVGPTAPESVKNAWMQAAEEIGVNGYGIKGNGMLSHISQMLVMQMERRLNGVQNYNDILGNTAASALQAAKQALYALEHPLAPNQQKSEEVKQQIAKEKEFYASFIEKLEHLSQTEAAEDNQTKTSWYTSAEIMQILHGKAEEMYEKIKNGETEPSYQIGKCSFTEKQWDKLLEKFDAVQEMFRKQREEENARREAKTKAKREAEKTGTVNNSKAEQNEALLEELTDLLSNTTACSFPPENSETEKPMYITAYTSEGIYCSKLGPIGSNSEKLWFIPFRDASEYNKVMSFLDNFDQKDNLRFASNENFWKDFLNDEIEEDDFVEFFKETNHGVPDYSLLIEDSMYIDREKIKYAAYMNRPGTKIFTQEEMLAEQAAAVERNAKKLKQYL